MQFIYKTKIRLNFNSTGKRNIESLTAFDAIKIQGSDLRIMNARLY